MLGEKEKDCPICAKSNRTIYKIINDNYFYYSCLHCGTVYINNNDLTGICKTENDNDVVRSDQNILRLNRMKDILPFSYSNRCVIDFGCGNGQFVNFLLNSTDYTVFGIDKDTPLQLKDFDNNTVHGIYLTEVIEHIDNPNVLFETIKRILVPDGKVYIETSFVDNLKIQDTYVSPDIGHRTIFSILSITKLLEKYGFVGSFINKNVLVLTKVV